MGFRRDEPAVNYSLHVNAKTVTATDVFGKKINATITNKELQIAVSDTPVFIDVNKL